MMQKAGVVLKKLFKEVAMAVIDQESLSTIQES